MLYSATRLKFALAALVGVAATASLAAYDWYTVEPPGAMAKATYVGSQTCAQCHQPEYKQWLGSDHDRAMDLATDETVLADFNGTSFTRHGVTTRFFRSTELATGRRDGKFMVNTEGPDGVMQDYQIKYTFGVRPLQQYMVEFPDGRVQVLRVSWDTQKKEWFEVTPPDVPDERIEPGDPLHWTGIAQNWNTTCADCHSTNVHKNYDVATNTYHTDFEEIDVSCEECHGPGSVHVDLARKWSPFWDRNIGYGLAVLKDPVRGVSEASLKRRRPLPQLEMCAKCHARRYQVHEDFRPGRPLLDYYEPSLLAENLYHSDGQILDEVYEYGSFLQSNMHANHVRCTDCHDPHSLKLKFTGNALCTQCHLPAKYDTAAHHHHKGSEWLGSSDSEPPESRHTGGSAEPRPQAPPDGTQCIECHMPSRLYMVIDERRDHSFRVPRPDLTVQLGTPNACNDCHVAGSLRDPELDVAESVRESDPSFGETRLRNAAQWAADAVVKWYGPKRPDGLPLWAPAIAAGREGKPEGEQMLLDLVEQRATPAVVRATAIDLLANYEGDRAAATVRKSLDDADPLVRATAVRRLSDENAERIVSDLSSALDDPIRAVRLAAAARLADVPMEQLAGSGKGNSSKRAMEEFRESQELSLDHAGGHLVLASRARRRGETVEALEHLRTAIKLEPYLAGPRAELASLVQQIGGEEAEISRLRTEEAELLERDAKLAPDNAMIFFQLGNMRYLLGQLDEAQTAYAAAVERAPRNYDFVMMLALLHEKRYGLTGNEDQFNAAVAALKKLAELQPADPRGAGIYQRLMETRRQRQGRE